MKDKNLVLLLVLVVVALVIMLLPIILLNKRLTQQEILVGVETGKILCLDRATYFDKNSVESETENIKIGDTLMLEVIENFITNEKEYNLYAYPTDINTLVRITGGYHLKPKQIHFLEKVVVTSGDEFNTQLKLSGELKELF